MRKNSFLRIVIACSTLFTISLVVDEELVSDRAQRQVFEGALLALLLGIIGVTATKYYGDVTTRDVIKGLTQTLSELEKRIQNLESNTDKQQNHRKDE